MIACTISGIDQYSSCRYSNRLTCEFKCHIVTGSGLFLKEKIFKGVITSINLTRMLIWCIRSKGFGCAVLLAEHGLNYFDSSNNLVEEKGTWMSWSVSSKVSLVFGNFAESISSYLSLCRNRKWVLNQINNLNKHIMILMTDLFHKFRFQSRDVQFTSSIWVQSISRSSQRSPQRSECWSSTFKSMSAVPNTLCKPALELVGIM